MFNSLSKNIAKFLLVALIFTQVFGAVFAVMPIKRAQALADALDIGSGAAQGTAAEITSVPNVIRHNWYEYKDSIYKNIMIGIAYAFAQNFMQRFVNKLTEKYKIRNFLYYDQILTNYYLTNFIRDKIQDPDLRQIYVLLESAYITGQPTYTTPGSGPDPKQAVIPRFKKAVADLYKKQTGIDVKYIASPPADADVDNYLAQSRFYYLNNPGYTETNLRQQFGEFQSAATTAAQLEVIVGNGLKAGRYVGGYCDIGAISESDGRNTNISTLADCERNGGKWQQSTLDQARSFIDNPTAYVDKWMQGMVTEITGSNFDPNNFWFVIGNAFGRFLVNRLMIDKPNGVLNEDPRGYVPTTNNLGEGVASTMANTDIDGDGIPDGYDVEGDGVIDTCIYGGIAPSCVGSRSIGAGGGGGGGGGGGSGPCKDPGIYTADYEGDVKDAYYEVVATNPGGIADAPNTTDNSYKFLQEVAAVLRSRGFESTADVLNGNSIPSSTGDIIAIWRPGDTLLERYDAVIAAGAGDRAMADAEGVHYTGDVPVVDCV